MMSNMICTTSGAWTASFRGHSGFNGLLPSGDTPGLMGFVLFFFNFYVAIFCLFVFFVFGFVLFVCFFCFFLFVFFFCCCSILYMTVSDWPFWYLLTFLTSALLRLSFNFFITQKSLDEMLWF